ncbi:hypothetical protein JPM7_1040 [Metamycoplasma equirhinis]|uniref:hypothetical protein n=1 Tax=Metamycoplasma equirhinis TaxID=92402 RepID=UPI0025729ED5|nr:hypothetical protein [Metamycoplasma equirhinis]BDX52497.1 hypothetical protein JPM7_1040 [Metamycoplasma equirhinis]
MITIDFSKTLDTSYIKIKNTLDNKGNFNIDIDLNKTEDWNKQSINKFLLKLLATAEDKIEVNVTEVAQAEALTNDSLKFIINLFETFATSYNNN